MAIPVTTRSGKGSPLTQAEMDTNLTNLARSATETEEGNIEIATPAEVVTGTSDTLAVVPSTLTAGLNTAVSPGTGNLVLPDWAENLSINWVTTTTQSVGNFFATFNNPFATSAYVAFANAVGDNLAATVTAVSASGVSGSVVDTLSNKNASPGITVYVLAIGKD